MALVAGVDSSTQSVKVVVRDAETGAWVREARASHPDGTSVDPAAWVSALGSAMEGLLEPEYKDVTQGKAEVRELFKVPKVGTIAGSFVTEGKITRKSSIRLVRDGIQVFDGKILSLRRFKDDAKEVLTGFECGIGIDGFNDLKLGDIIESYIQERVERKL